MLTDLEHKGLEFVSLYFQTVYIKPAYDRGFARVNIIKAINIYCTFCVL